MLRDEAGAHVPGLECRVARQTQQEVDVGVQSDDLRVVRERAAVCVAVRTALNPDIIKMKEY